jgi:hypothetical protein
MDGDIQIQVVYPITKEGLKRAIEHPDSLTVPARMMSEAEIKARWGPSVIEGLFPAQKEFNRR